MEKLLSSEIDTSEIKRAFIDINKITGVVKYRAFQYRMLHGAILLNDRLIHMGIAETEKCYNCNQEKETVIHFFVNCTKANTLWQSIAQFLQQFLSLPNTPQITKKNIIMCDIELQSCAKMLISIAKQKMFAAKCGNKETNIHAIINEFEFIHEMEKKQPYVTKHKQKNTMKNGLTLYQ